MRLHVTVLIVQLVRSANYSQASDHPLLLLDTVTLIAHNCPKWSTMLSTRQCDKCHMTHTIKPLDAFPFLMRGKEKGQGAN